MRSLVVLVPKCDSFGALNCRILSHFICETGSSEHLFRIFYDYFVCIDALPACMSIPHIHSWYSQRPDEDIESPGIGVPDGFHLPCGHWESKPGPLGEQLVLYTAEPSL